MYRKICHIGRYAEYLPGRVVKKITSMLKYMVLIIVKGLGPQRISLILYWMEPG